MRPLINIFPNTVWDKLYTAKTYDGARFPVGKIYEDVLIFPEIADRVERVTSIPEELYTARSRQGSITHQPFSVKSFDRLYVKVAQAEYFNRWGMTREAAATLAAGIKQSFRSRRALPKGTPGVAERLWELRGDILPLADRIPRRGTRLGDRVVLFTYKHCPRVCELLWLIARRERD